MKKIIGILSTPHFEESDINGACGGSETWAIRLSQEFERSGCHVIIFREGEDYTYSPTGVEYVPLEFMDFKLQTQHFDTFIFSRNIDFEIYDKIIKYECADKIYVQAHEIYVWKNGIYNERFDYENDFAHVSKIEKFIALSDFHKSALTYYCGIPADKISIIGNGCDTDVFWDNYNDEYALNDCKDRGSIIWSSCFGRGADILIDDILPIIHRKWPQFKVKICGYVDVVPDKYKNRPDVELIGFNLTKKQYYDALCGTCCWFYPCVTGETFNISALDAVINNLDVVSPMLHGMEHTFGPFRVFGMQNKFGSGETKDKNYDWGSYQTDKNSDEYKRACQEAADMIIDFVTNYEKPERVKIRTALKNYILENYTWAHVVEKWKKELNW